MNPFVFAIRRPMTSLMLIAALVGGGAYGMDKAGVRVITPRKTPKTYAVVQKINAQALKLKGFVVTKLGGYAHKPEEEAEHEEPHKVVVTSPKVKDVVVTQDYVCQIRSQQHIAVQAFEGGYLKEIAVKEGQAVKKGDPMFRIVPTIFQAKLVAEQAEAELAQLEFNNTQTLAQMKSFQAVSTNEVKIYQAKLKRAQAKLLLAQAELDFTNIVAPFDGIVDRLQEQLGSFIKEGDILTTLSDNAKMWVYFNVPEKQYLEYMAEFGRTNESLDVELILANHNKFPHMGKIDMAHGVGAIEANFNPETGNISFRADFPNPAEPVRLLRHGQTGKVIISRVLHDAIVIPQRATFENLAKQYVYVVGKDNVVHQREIEVRKEQEDIFVLEKGILSPDDRIIFEGISQVHDGQKVEYEYRSPETVLADQKNKAE